MASQLFNVDKQVNTLFILSFDLLIDLLQLTFYGAYHSNKTNVLIHIVCVPLLLWFVSLHMTYSTKSE